MSSISSGLKNRSRASWDSSYQAREDARLTAKLAEPKMVTLVGDFVEQIAKRRARVVLHPSDYARQRFENAAAARGFLEQYKQERAEEAKFKLTFVSIADDEATFTAHLNDDYQVPPEFKVPEGYYEISLGNEEMCIASDYWGVSGEEVNLVELFRHAPMTSKEVNAARRELNPPPPPPPPAPKPVRRAAVKADVSSPTFIIPGSELALQTVSASPKFKDALSHCETDLFALLAFHVAGPMSISAIIGKIGQFGRLTIAVYDEQGTCMLAANLSNERQSVMLKSAVVLPAGTYRLAWQATESTECSCWAIDKEFREMLNSAGGEIVLGMSRGPMPAKLDAVEPAHERFPSSIPRIALKS